MWRVLGVAAAAVAMTGIGFAVLAIGHGATAPQMATASPEQVLSEVAQDSLRRRLRNPPGLSFSDISVVRFGPEDERAVCGKVGGVDFILRVLLPRDGSVPQEREGRRPAYTTVLEQGPGLPPVASAADRFCRPGGAVMARAASPAPSMDAAPPAPSPSGLSRPVSTEGSGPGASLAIAASGAVQVRSNANLRASPVGGSEVLAVVPQGSALRVFGKAPGGWVQVGDATPQGWVHSSMLSGAN